MDYQELINKRPLLSQRLFCLSFGLGPVSSPSGVTRPREFCAYSQEFSARQVLKCQDDKNLAYALWAPRGVLT
jgi:hypothetical protein